MSDRKENLTNPDEGRPLEKTEGQESTSTGDIEAPRIDFQQILENQKKELELKSRELDFKYKAIEYGFTFSRETLAAKAKDREQTRIHQQGGRKVTYIFAASVCVIVAVLLIFAFYLDKDQIALEIIRAIFFLVSGGAGGYAVGLHHSQSLAGRQPADNSPDNPQPS